MDGSEDEEEIGESLESFPIAQEEFLAESIGGNSKNYPNIHPDHPPSKEGIEIVILRWEEPGCEWDFRREEESDSMERNKDSGDDSDLFPESDEFAKDSKPWEYIRQWTAKYDK